MSHHGRVRAEISSATQLIALPLEATDRPISGEQGSPQEAGGSALSHALAAGVSSDHLAFRVQAVPANEVCWS